MEEGLKIGDRVEAIQTIDFGYGTKVPILTKGEVIDIADRLGMQYKVRFEGHGTFWVRKQEIWKERLSMIEKTLKELREKLKETK